MKQTNPYPEGREAVLRVVLKEETLLRLANLATERGLSHAQMLERLIGECPLQEVPEREEEGMTGTMCRLERIALCLGTRDIEGALRVAVFMASEQLGIEE